MLGDASPPLPSTLHACWGIRAAVRGLFWGNFPRGTWTATANISPYSLSPSTVEVELEVVLEVELEQVTIGDPVVESPSFVITATNKIIFHEIAGPLLL